jgi:replication-associated recombination protein RarA
MAKTFPWPTVGGYDLYEVQSAFQKSIRRSLENDSLFWGTELYMSEYESIAWNRMKIIASEDIGIADPDACVRISVLYENWKRDKKAGESKLYFIHAILTLVRAKKSRIVDHALITFFDGNRSHRDVPDWALDCHTAKGRSMGRGVDHFFEFGSILDPSIEHEDAYKETAHKIRRRKEY